MGKNKPVSELLTEEPEKQQPVRLVENRVLTKSTK